MEPLCGKGEEISADRIECNVTEIEQSGEADDDVEAPTQHDIDEHAGGETDDITGRERQKRQRHGKDNGEEGKNREAAPVKRGELPSRAGGTHRPQCLHEVEEKPPAEDGSDCDRRDIKARDDGQCSVDLFRLKSDQRYCKDERHPGGQRGIPEQADPGDLSDQSPRLARHHTFSTSGRPSNPVGRKMRTRTSTMKTATSLYSTEK
jgi:hypothetical protein